MECVSSYIFLKRVKKKEASKKKTGNNKIVIETAFEGIFDNTFNSVVYGKNDNKYLLPRSGCFDVEYNGIVKKVCFKYNKIGSNYYLDVSVIDDDITTVLGIYENLNEKFEKKEFNQNFIAIRSYDFNSKYYCDELYPKFNEFERRLRELMDLMYTVNFKSNYYLETTSKELSDKIKENANKNKSCPRSDREIKLAFESLEYNQINDLLFTKKITGYEEEKLNEFLTQNKDLSKLSDEELREYYNLGKNKSDWGRFFSDKVTINNFEDIFEQIREVRNQVAHCRTVSKEDFDTYLSKLDELINKIIDAIRIAKTTDFMDKNIEELKASYHEFSIYLMNVIKNISYDFDELTEPLVGSINALKNNLKIDEVQNKMTNITDSLTDKPN